MKPADVASPPEPVAPLPAAEIEIGKIHFEGNIIPHPWYQHITLSSGKPDLPAIIILAEIVYWYRPYQTLDHHGKPLRRKRVDGDLFQSALKAAALAVAADGYIYLEAPVEWTEETLAPLGLVPYRHLKAGAVHAHLLRRAA